ncbi:MAG TPA: lipid-A-disaccharide synthase [Terriglobales bacterium]|nr:lipid-A-disaccharide synthase [Terriglobales bacterium]
MRLLISAGEASGEMYGAQLIEALRRRLPDLECFGVGGERMQAAGCDLVVQSKELAVVGITEILPRLPKIYGEFRKLVRAMDERKPQAAVLIDSPAFHFKVARQLHRRGIPVIYYVAPQLWAWRSGRVRLVRRYFKKVLVIFPFEEQWYRERGVDAEYVGHPLADVARPSESAEEFVEGRGYEPDKPIIALLPGSRHKEIRMNLPAMLRTAELLGCDYQFVLPIAPGIDPSWLDLQVQKLNPSYNFILFTTTDTRALAHARAAVVASGTATVEAAMMGTPMVVVYRVSPLTWRLGRPLVHVKNFAMVNLIAGEAVVPELIQADFTAENVAAKLREILPDGPVREKMERDLAQVRARLRSSDDSRSAAERAADAVLRTLA